MRCAACPVDVGSPCDGGNGRRPHFCAWAATGEPSKLGLIRDVSAMDAAPEPPPLLTRAVNFAGAVVAHVAAGLPTADPATKAARLAVCGGCERFIAPNSCAVCGCNLDAKAGWAEQECPEGKWAAVTGT